MKNYVGTIKPLSRGLPKTGQIISYASGDDGEHEVGWWLGLLNENNRTRFLVKTINGDDVVIDLATGLMWARDGSAAGCCNGERRNWVQALDYCHNLVFAGYTDWRLPNLNELLSIVSWRTYNPSVWNSFTNVGYVYETWTSTTRAYNTVDTKSVSFSEGTIVNRIKTYSRHIRAVRGGL